MMTQSVIGDILQTIFQLPAGYIVPKQGNWYNPQDKTGGGTWIAYLIRGAKPKIYPYLQPTDDPDIWIRTVIMSGVLELQFVGSKAEELAQSVSLWTIRPDIQQLFDDNQAQIFYDQEGAYEVSNFAQEGLNGVLAYNVQLQIEWSNMIQMSGTVVTTIEGMGGNVTVND